MDCIESPKFALTQNALCHPDTLVELSSDTFGELQAVGNSRPLWMG